MKGTITPDGKLTLVPETPTEHYALKKWKVDWQDQKGILEIKSSDPRDDEVDQILHGYKYQGK